MCLLCGNSTITHIIFTFTLGKLRALLSKKYDHEEQCTYECWKSQHDLSIHKNVPWYNSTHFLLDFHDTKTIICLHLFILLLKIFLSIMASFIQVINTGWPSLSILKPHNPLKAHFQHLMHFLITTTFHSSYLQSHSKGHHLYFIPFTHCQSVQLTKYHFLTNEFELQQII